MLGRMASEPILPVKRILHDRLYSLPREPVRAFPAVFRSEARSLGSQPVMQWTLAQAPAGRELAIRPRHLIMQPQNFRDTLAQKSAVVRPSPKSANVNRPKIHRLFTAKHPFGQVFARSTGRGNAH